MRSPAPRRLGRVRDRLLTAFLLLLGAAVLLTAAGWFGLRQTQTALAHIEGNLLPRVFDVLSLSEHAGQLAQIAPRLGDVATADDLALQRARTADLLGRIGLDATHLREPTPDLRRVVSLLQAGLRDNMPVLIERAQQKLAQQALLAKDLSRLQKLGRALHAASATAPADTDLPAVWTTLMLGATASDAATVGRLEADLEAQMRSARARGALGRLAPDLAVDLARLSEGPGSVLSCRQALIELDAQIATLVAFIGADARALDEQTSRYVAQLRIEAATQAARARAQAHGGEAFMVALTLLCLAIAVGATRYVHRIVGEIESIAHQMSRLAEGDTAQPTPASSRPDELGELARSFRIFRENLIAKQQLVRDLHAQSELLEAVLQSLTDGLAVFSPGGHLLMWNRRLEDLLARQKVALEDGASVEDLLQALPAAVVWREEGQPTFRSRAELSVSTWMRADHVELHAPDGQVLDLRSCPMPGGGRVTLVTDLSARHAMEHQLQQAQKLEMLGQFTGGVAHDFNNCLGTILGNLALLETSVSADSRALVQWQRVRRAAANAAGLTRRLLAFARRQPLQAEDVLLDEMIEEMKDLIEYSAGDAVTLRLSLAAGPLPAHVDRGQLENAVLNLALNSAAAMPHGGTLVVETRAVEHPGAEGQPDATWLELSVEDTGIGMSEAQAARAFEPFYSTRPIGQGSGLGLSIVYGFVRQSRGEIDLRSSPGAGTRVTLRFPAVPERSRQIAAGPSPPISVPSLEGRALLLVEDDAAFRETLSEQLRQLGVGTHAVGDAESALAALAGGLRVQGVLTDVRLGTGANGLQLARAIRARWPGLHVLLMSGELPEFEGRDPVAANLDDDSVPFLQKPFTIAQVIPWLQALPEAGTA